MSNRIIPSLPTPFDDSSIISPQRRISTSDSNINTKSRQSGTHGGGGVSSLLSSLQTLQRNAIQRECQQALFQSSSSSQQQRNTMLHLGAPPPPTSIIQPPLSFRTGRPLSQPSSSQKTSKTSSTTTTTSNDQWYYMRATPMTTELKMDLQILQNRNYLDPKRFYKSSSLNSKKLGVLQVGTVIEGSKEYYSHRYTNQERSSTLIQEIMKDTKINTYTTHKYKTMQQQHTIKSQQQRSRKKPALPHHKNNKKPIFKKQKL